LGGTHEAKRIAEQNLFAAARKMQTNYNLRRRGSQFQEGDLVLKRNFVLSSGPEISWPSSLLNLRGHIVYPESSALWFMKLRDPATKKNLDRWHIAKLKPYVPPST
jgi:hypothetical protein